MVVLKAKPNLTKDYILSRVSQREVFEFYLGGSVQYFEKINNPFRRDRNASCSFAWVKEGTKLIFRDLTEEFSMDCFDVVQRKYNINFYEALDQIYNDMIKGSESTRIPMKPDEYDIIAKQHKVFIVETKPYQKQDVEYLKSHRISSEVCKEYKIFSINRIWVNYKCYYIYDEKDPALGYYFGGEGDTQEWKIYFYMRDKFGPTPKFIQNTNQMNGLAQLPETGNILIITKSMKDVLVLKSFGVWSIAPQSEAARLPEDLIKNLKERFPVIYSLYDFDRAGIAGANRIRKRFGIQPLFLTNGRFRTLDFGAKDIADYVLNFGENQTKELIKYTIESIIRDEITTDLGDTRIYYKNSAFEISKI